MKKKIFGIMAIIGIILIFGAVGKADYMEAMGEYYSFASMLKLCITGVLLIVPMYMNNMKEMAIECEKNNLKTKSKRS